MAHGATTAPHPVTHPDDDVEAPGELGVLQAFVNTRTLDPDEELLTDPAVLGRWLSRHRLLEAGERITEPTDLERAIAIREAFRDVLDENPSGDALALIEEASRDAPLAVAFPEGHAALRPVRGGLDGAIARLLAIALHAMHDGTWERLKVCSEDQCRWVFYDESRNRSGRFCGTTCGTRAKVRAYRQRQREDRD